MKLLKILTIPILLSYPLFSNEDMQEENNWNYFGEFKTYMTSIHKNKINKDDYTDKMSYSSMQIHADYLNDNFYFSMTPYSYIYFTKSGDDLLTSNYTTPFQEQAFLFRSLYMSYTINSLSFGVGVLPFSNSFPMQYTSDYYQDGEGLSIISDLDPLAIFLKYKFNDNNKILIGAGILDTGFIPTGQYVNKHNVDKSYGIWATQTLRYDKIKIINDIKYTNVFYDSIQAGEFYNAGTGISFDDSEYSGWSFYNVLAFSLYKNNSIAVKEQIIKNYGITQEDMELYPSSFVFDNKTYTGAANLLGFRKDLDLFDFESFVNFEWFHLFGDWTSANKGALYNSNCTQVSNIRDNSYFINYGIRVNELTTVKINYTFIEFSEIQNIGAPSATPVAQSYGAQRSSADIIKLDFSYKF